MIRSVITFLVVASTTTFAANTWKDGNGVEWSPTPIKSTFYRVADRCKQMKMRLPSSNDLLDAIEFGLFDPKTNTVFANEIGGFDWMWVNDPSILSSRWMVSKQGDKAADQHSERHYGICRSF